MKHIESSCPRSRGTVYAYGAGGDTGKPADSILQGEMKLRKGKCYFNGILRTDRNSNKRNQVCTGDSGGPLTFTHPITGKEKQIGIIKSGLSRDINKFLSSSDEVCIKAPSMSLSVAITETVKNFIRQFIPNI